MARCFWVTVWSETGNRPHRRGLWSGQSKTPAMEKLGEGFWNRCNDGSCGSDGRRSRDLTIFSCTRRVYGCSRVLVCRVIPRKSCSLMMAGRGWFQPGSRPETGPQTHPLRVSGGAGLPRLGQLRHGSFEMPPVADHHPRDGPLRSDAMDVPCGTGPRCGCRLPRGAKDGVWTRT